MIFRLSIEVHAFTNERANIAFIRWDIAIEVYEQVY